VSAVAAISLVAPGENEAVLDVLLQQFEGHGIDTPRAENLYRRNGFRPLPRARWVRRLGR
jgi:hypothetical protein